MTRAGIIGIGAHIPDEVRRNDAWPADQIASWLERRRAAPPPPRDGLSIGQHRILDAMAIQGADPFLGTHERRVLAPELSILDLEERAARDALSKCHLDGSSIDMLLLHSVVPDYQLANSACGLHERLGLPVACLSLQTEATAYTSFAQLALAEAAIVAGRARHVLAVQSCVGSRIVDRNDPSSLLLGDGATAIVFGPVSNERGILATTHYTDGRSVDGLVMSVPGGRWYDPGTPRAHVANPKHLYEAQLQIADTCERAVHDALSRSGHTVDDVDLLAVYQGTPWLQQVVYEQLGITRTPPSEVFSRFGYLSSAMLPAALWSAVQDDEVAEDDLVVIVGGGTGMTYGAAVLRWGST